MTNLNAHSSTYIDLVASHLRTQVESINTLLETIERGRDYDIDHVKYSLRDIEGDMRRLRSFMDH